MAKEQLISSRKSWAQDPKDWKHRPELKKPGDTITVFAGAPGIGKWTYRITRTDEAGHWGIEIENTVRTLEPEETI